MNNKSNGFIVETYIGITKDSIKVESLANFATFKKENDHTTLINWTIDIVTHIL